MTYVYDRNFAAWLNGRLVTIPDQIAADQRHHDDAGTVFSTRCGALVRLDGDAYGLHTSGTGDVIVTAA